MSRERDTDELKHFQELSRLYLKRLRVLELQAAQFGVHTPAYIVADIESVKDQVKYVESKLRLLNRGLPSETVDTPQSGHVDIVVTALSDEESPELIMAEAKVYAPTVQLIWTHHPPESAEYMLWYLPKEIREAVIGDLAEGFHLIYERFGQRRAIRWYYYQVFASFWPIMASKTTKALKWSVFGWLGDVLRRFIS